MFVAIYQSYLKEGHEQAYRKAWKQIASYFITHRGAIGSCLHRVEDGSFLAYSRWPNRDLKEKSWPQGDDIASDLPQEIINYAQIIKNAIDPTMPFIEKFMSLEEDLLSLK